MSNMLMSTDGLPKHTQCAHATHFTEVFMCGTRPPLARKKAEEGRCDCKLTLAITINIDVARV
eukprot:349801-Chlamydomonas_euryale.AAC.31